MKKLLAVLVGVPVLLLLLGVMLFVLSIAPPLLSVVSLVLLAVVAGWFFFGRRGASTKIVGSESSLMGRQSSKDGLL